MLFIGERGLYAVLINNRHNERTIGSAQDSSQI